MQRLLLATDFSDHAVPAHAWAAQLAAAHDATLSIIHVTETEERDETIERQLADAAEAARRAGVGEVTTVVEVGSPWDRVAEQQSHREADLVVIGSRGLTRFSRLRLGSTADRIVRHAPGPVLTVHPEDAQNAGIRTLLIATDFSDEAALAAEAALQLLTSTETTIVLLHAWFPLVDVDTDSTACIVTDTLGLTEASAHEGLTRLAEPLRARGYPVETVTRPGPPAQVIEEEAAERQASLVALGTFGRTGLAHLLLGSVAERVLHRARCPVLTVRHRTAERPSD